MYGKQALHDSFDTVSKQTHITLKDLAPFTAYEWLLTEPQKTRFADIGKELYLSAAKKRHASLQTKVQERKGKRQKLDSQSELTRVRSLFTSR